MVRRRLIRDDAPPPTGAVLVRALFDSYPEDIEFDQDVLIADATYNLELFGYYGLSLWLASSSWPLDRVLSLKTRKARRVALFTAGELSARGLDLLPSGRAPHYDATHLVQIAPHRSAQVTEGSVEKLVELFMSASYTVEHNPFYEQDPS